MKPQLLIPGTSYNYRGEHTDRDISIMYVGKKAHLSGYNLHHFNCANGSYLQLFEDEVEIEITTL